VAGSDPAPTVIVANRKRVLTAVRNVIASFLLFISSFAQNECCLATNALAGDHRFPVILSNSATVFSDEDHTSFITTTSLIS
jgi:hypothetical protein